MQHIPGIINFSDDLSKALGWILHSQYAHQGMGHYRIGSPQDSELPAHPVMLEQGQSELERVLEPIRHCVSVAENSTSHIEELVWS